MSRDNIDEKLIEDKIKDMYCNVEADIPRGILPDNINIISEKGSEYDEDDVPEFEDVTLKKRMRRRRIFKVTGLVAGVAAAIACVVISGKIINDNNYYGKKEETVKVANNDADSNASKDNETFNTFPTVDSYDEIYEIISKNNYYDGELFEDDIAMSINESVGMDATSDSKAAVNESLRTDGTEQKKQSSTNEYSDTNKQVEGVDESDIIKTDGKYIYVLGNYEYIRNYIGDEEYSEDIIYSNESDYSNDTECVVRIVRTDNGKMEQVANINLAEDMNNSIFLESQEMYLNDGKLVVIVNDYEKKTEELKCVAMIYDVSEPEKPKHIDNIDISGSYENSRVSEGYLYLFSRFYVNTIDINDYDAYIPKIEENMLKCSDICIPPDVYGDSYVVMIAVDIGDAKKISECKVDDKKAIMINSGNMYVSRNAIYFLNWADESNRRSYKSATQIVKYNYNKGAIKYVGETIVEGEVDSQFSADEYEDNLRIITTVRSYHYNSGKEKMSNTLYILDKNLKKIGSIENIAKDERVYSARFYGDYGYVVTYREMDPLFTIDLSDPHNPEIVGELELPGFSDYLQGFGPDRLFGIGYEVKKVGKESVTRDILKISMFNIADKENVTEEQTLLLKNYEDSEACINHKSLLINYEKNLIGFEARSYSSYDDVSRYLVYSYGDRGFELLGEIDTAKDMNVDNYDKLGQRGMFIGDYLYIIQRNQGIVSYKIDGLGKVDVVKF